MKKLVLPVLALLAWALTPTVEAQPESAYYGLSLGEFDYTEGDGLGGDLFTDSSQIFFHT